MTQTRNSKNTYHQGVIILGTPRSGTTLLRRILNTHPNIACPGETNLFSACARFMHSEKIAENIEVGVIAGLEHAGFDRNEVLNRLRDFAFGFHQEHARNKGKPRWAEKTAFDSFYIDEIERLCGNEANFICMIRNGMDFVISMQDLSLKNQTYLHEVHEYIKRYAKPLEAYAHCWRELTSRILDFADAHQENAVLVKYEDLISDPQSTMKTILNLIGEELPEDLIRKAMDNKEDVGLGDWKTYSSEAINSDNTNRAKVLSDSTKSELGLIMNDLLARCGYETTEILPDDNDEDAKRRYELGLLLSSLKP